MAGLEAKVMSFTADSLTYSPDPPAYYGMITFAEGGRFMIDFTDIDKEQVEGRRQDAHDLPHPRQRHDARRLQALFLEGGAGLIGSPSTGKSVSVPTPHKETSMARGIKDKVAILGMGCSKFGERWDSGAEELMVEAYKEAIADAGIDTNQIDAAWFSTAIDEVSMSASRASRCRRRCACPTSR